MKYIVAVSGGVDSVVLLDMLVNVGGHELTVAHFDHGIRSDSADDARFVRGLAEKYALPFVEKREELGAKASEELARTRRYEFLREEAKKRGAEIATAHHADDVVETIAINLIRGTGWRGAAVLETPGIARPLLRFTKEKIRAYALANRLEWVEDSTNGETAYLRNKVRRALAVSIAGDTEQSVLAIWKSQVKLRKEIEPLLEVYVRKDGEYGRYYLIHIDPGVACELLRAAIFAATGVSPMRPQTERALLAVKTAKPGAIFEVSKGARLRFSRGAFIVETP